MVEICESVEGVALGLDQGCGQHEAAVFDRRAHPAERDGVLGWRDAVGLHVADGVFWRHEVQVDIVLVSFAEGLEGGDGTLGDAEHGMEVTLVEDGEECIGEVSAIEDHDIAG